MLASVLHAIRDFSLAEDAVQEAFGVAFERWPRDGWPANPRAWLVATARNKAIDVLRRARRFEEIRGELRHSEESTHVPDETARDVSVPDERLRLIFTCCHPALSMEVRVALTLRTVVGLDIEEIARAFFVSAPAMQKRLVRGRAKIRDAGIPYRVPGPEQLPMRTDAVLAVLYALFTEGYAGSRELLRIPLAEEAIRLARLLDGLMTDSPQLPEVRSLLALMLFQHSRSSARLDCEGELVPLAEQDRTRWDTGMIGDGVAALAAAEAARRRFDGIAGPYRLQAEIAMLHATAPSAEATDAARIAELYARLARVAPSPIVDLNRAVAVSFAEGPEAGLILLRELGGGVLDEYHLLHAATADLLRRAGRTDDAIPHYERAFELAPTPAERRFLSRRIAEAREASDGRR